MIHIYQRHCNFSYNSLRKKRPEWFSREHCFVNLLKTINKDTKLHVVFDGEPAADHFINKFKSDVDFIQLNGGDDARSFLNMINYVAEQNHANDDIIYFLEDDYLHTNNWVHIMKEGFEQLSMDYLTLYDHYDKYFLPMYDNLTSKIMTTTSSHWRTTPSTTNTYACLFSTFIKHIDIHREYCDLKRGLCRDHDKFTRLWKEGSNLASSIPGCSTHVEAEFLSPLVDWSKI